MKNSEDRIFVYEGKEWQLTGRVAKKTLFSKRNLNKRVGDMTIVEICPTGVGGSDPTFHKWVDPRELFYVHEVSIEDVDVELLNMDIGNYSDE